MRMHNYKILTWPPRILEPNLEAAMAVGYSFARGGFAQLFVQRFCRLKPVIRVFYHNTSMVQMFAWKRKYVSGRRGESTVLCEKRKIICQRILCMVMHVCLVRERGKHERRYCEAPQLPQSITEFLPSSFIIIDQRFTQGVSSLGVISSLRTVELSKSYCSITVYSVWNKRMKICNHEKHDRETHT